MFRKRLSMAVRWATIAAVIALAVACSAQSTPPNYMNIRGYRQFCQVLPFPASGANAGPGHASGTVTLCARWRYRNGITNLSEVWGSFTTTSGILRHPWLQFNVETEAVAKLNKKTGGLISQKSVVVPWRVVPVHGSQTTSAGTGWFPAARLTGDGRRSLSWRLLDPYLSVSLLAAGDNGAPTFVGGAGMPLVS
jgi:hypothetical protein